MTEFNIKLAGAAVHCSVGYESTKAYCKEYLTDETPKYFVTVDSSDIEREKKEATESAMKEGRAVSAFSEKYLETLALYRKISTALIRDSVLLMHGSVVAVDGTAYMFTAPSGTGKTTHLRLWQQLLGDRMQVVNGDKPLLRVTDKGVTAYGTPWRGKEQYGGNISAPLKAIAILERSEENRITEIKPGEAVDVLLRQTFMPDKSEDILLTVRLIDKLTKNVRFYRLGCNMQPEAAAVAFEAMSE